MHPPRTSTHKTHFRVAAHFPPVADAREFGRPPGETYCLVQIDGGGALGARDTHAPPLINTILT